MWGLQHWLPKSDSNQYFILIISCGFHSVITSPTRVPASSAASIDHMLRNFGATISECNVYDAVISYDYQAISFHRTSSTIQRTATYRDTINLRVLKQHFLAVNDIICARSYGCTAAIWHFKL